MASTEKVLRNNKNQNIQVFVRLRPLNARERAIRSLGVVEVVNNKEVIVRQSPQTLHTKKFTFDRAFGPNAPQVEVYKEVVSPLIAEVLAGYNCTVFAYGQTGTGKTHTMVGESTAEGCSWQNDPLSGIIPRALSQLFDELRISNTEYTVRVSYLELYNEELFDLLSSSDDNSKLRIYEDVTRKGSTIVNGLEEITVYNKNEVYEIMAQGQERKKVASTLMNAQSSRSHTVFTIVVHMKENCPKGEELVKIGKLNLVDLAGSENISKAGSDNPAKKERARECVNINQSLLTLGRVITALVEKHPHIPYRESKLTRILQESLGGRTKTSIIATISPGHKDLEETMSTLEYAHRAKNIQNKPEVNQKLTKQAILKEFAEEIDKLKRELTASREKNGVYLPTETYVEMTLKHDEQRREIQELLLKKRAMEEERARMESVFAELENKCTSTEEQLTATKEQLEDTTNRLSEQEQQYLEQRHLVERHQQTERHLSVQAQQLVRVADNATADLGNLHDTVDRRKSVELTNKEVVTQYREESEAIRNSMLDQVQASTDQFAEIRDDMQTRIDDHARDASLTAEANVQDLKLLVAKMGMFVNEIKSMAEASTNEISATANESRTSMEKLCAHRREEMHSLLGHLVQSVAACVQQVAGTDLTGTVSRCTEQWIHDASSRVQCLQSTQSTHASNFRSSEARRGDAAQSHHRQRLVRVKEREQQIQHCIQELQKNKQAIEDRITRQLALIEEEKTETEHRFQNWMEEERRLLEDRLARHAAAESNALNVRLEKYKTELEVHKHMLTEATERCVQMQQLQIEASKDEMAVEEEYLSMCQKEIEDSKRNMDKFDKEFGEDVHAVKAEMEAFGRSVVQVVGHTADQFFGQLHNAHAAVEQETKTAISKEEDAAQKLMSGVNSALASVTDTAGQAIHSVVGKLVETTSWSTSSLNEMSSRSCLIAQSTLDHQSAQSSALSSASSCIQQLSAAVRSAVETQGETEGRYLMKEYRLYSPTGSTPARREFRYPRRLVATSPHDRILARFRRQQIADRLAADSPLPERGHRDSPDRDCIVVESDEGRQTSDSEVSESSAVSEDSAVAMQ